MDWLLIIGLVIASVLALLYYINKRITRDYGYWEAQGVKTIPPGWFFWKTLKMFVTPPEELERERFREYGKIYGTYEFMTRTISISEPELVKQVLVKDFHIFTNRRNINMNVPEFDSALSLARGEQWKRIRTVVGPSFTSGKMRKMNPLFEEAAEGLLHNFAAAADNNLLVDLKRYFSSFTTDIIGLTAFGVRVDSLKNPDHPFVVNGRKVFNKDASIFGLLLFFIPGVKKFFGKWTLKKMGFFYFFEVADQLIRKRTAQPNVSRQVDLMQLMLDAREGKLEKDEKEKDDLQNNHFFQDDSTGKSLPAWNVTKSLSDTEIKAQAMIFFMAGHETTAIALTFVTYDLAMNPDVQERLYEEVRDTYEQHGQFNYDVVKKMVYLEAVISESLRLHTVASRLEREASEDYVLGNTGIVVPKGGVVAISTYALHHDPDLFPDPEMYNPDRFLPENRSSIVPYSYLPFGDGPRNCIAMRFALLEFKLCMAKLVKEIKFVATDETRRKIEYFKNSGLLLPKEIKAKIERRK